MAYLPSERLSQLKWVVAASIIPGFVDLASVAVIARLMGALVGTRLGDGVPGVKVFGGDAVDQGLWLIAIFALLSWIGSFGKLGLQFLQQRLTARVWIDLSNQIHANVLAQGYEYHLTKSTAKLSTLMLSHIKKTSNSVVSPLLKMVGSVFSIVLLSVGILVIGRWSAVVLIVSLVFSYLVISQLITPYLRLPQAARKTPRTRTHRFPFDRLRGRDPYGGNHLPAVRSADPH